MRITLGWARCADNVADILRRGAWYPVVEESPDGHVVVEVRQQRVRLARADVTIRAEPPDHWNVVARTGVLRPTLGAGGRGSDVAAIYAVCRCVITARTSPPSPPASSACAAAPRRPWIGAKPARRCTLHVAGSGRFSCGA